MIDCTELSLTHQPFPNNPHHLRHQSGPKARGLSASIVRLSLVMMMDDGCWMMMMMDDGRWVVTDDG
jgi:hypothetical protein